MARYRYFRRSLGRRYYRNYTTRRWKNFSKYNYSNVKIDISFHVQYPSTDGAPQIYFAPGNAAVSYSFGALLRDHSDWSNIKPLYQLYKIRGLRFECTPMSCNAGQEAISQSSGVYLGFAYSLPTELSGNTSWLQYTERSIVLNPLQKTTKYWSNFGAQDDWKAINTELGGLVAVYCPEQSKLESAPIWHVRMVCYMTCKLAMK